MLFRRLSPRAAVTAAPAQPTFDLMRWFSATALLSVIIVSSVSAWTLSAFLTERMVRQYAEVTADSVRSIVAAENAYRHFDPAGTMPLAEMESFLIHMTTMPGIVRSNIYSADRRVIWSSDPAIIGRRFDRNDELDEALSAKLVVHSGVVEASRLPKAEHINIAAGTAYFVESYIPILDRSGNRVLGVVELYKVPTDLFAAIRGGARLIWLMAAVSGLFLFAALYWIVRRADRIIDCQQQRLVESESLAAVGEMGSAVAHGLRSPLASIRSSAELAMEYPLPPEARECTTDIVSLVDRLEEWIRHLLTYARPAPETLQAVELERVIEAGLAAYERDFARRGIVVRRELTAGLPAVRGDEALLTQVFGCLIGNAGEALQGAGEIVVASGLGPDGAVVAEVRDNGSGIGSDKIEQIFKPFFTTKSSGLGLGLPLVRRVMTRFGGTVEILSHAGAGTTARLRFPGRE